MSGFIIHKIGDRSESKNGLTQENRHLEAPIFLMRIKLMLKKALCTAVASIAVSTMCLPAAHAAPKGIPKLDIQRSMDYCDAKYLDQREPDYGGRSYCIERNSDGFSDAYEQFIKVRKQIPDGILDKIVDYSMKWIDGDEYQYDMFAYEFEKQTNAFMDLGWAYNNGRVSQELSDSCIKKWTSGWGTDASMTQWDMALYCIKN